MAVKKIQDKNRKIAVVGSGAIGSSIGADLTQAGFDVTLIDQWPSHVRAMKNNGLQIQFKDGSQFQVPVKALNLCAMSSEQLEFDIVFLACKSNDTRWMTEFIKPWLKADGFVVGAQNGMNDDAIASIVGRNRVVGCVVELQAELFTQGTIQRNTLRKGTWFTVGELDGTLTPRVDTYFSGKVDFLPDNFVTSRQKSYHTTNLRLTWNSPDRRYKVDAFVANLEDDDIISNDGLQSISLGQQALEPDNFVYYPPRTYGLRVGVNF